MSDSNDSAAKAQGLAKPATKRLKASSLGRFPFVIPEQMTGDLLVIRDRLFLELDGNDSIAAGFASSTNGEGTTTVLLKLALVTVRIRSRILLVDASPEMSLTKMVGLTGRPGLAELAAGEAIGEVVHTSDVKGLSVVPAGNFKDTELSNVDWPLLMPKLRERAEVVFLDMPPILTSTAAARASAAGDGLVMVVAAHRTRREVLQRAKQELQHYDGAKLLGTVLNGREYFIPGFLYRLG